MAFIGTIDMDYGKCPICAKEVSPHNNFVSLQGVTVHLVCFFQGVPNKLQEGEHEIAVKFRIDEITGEKKRNTLTFAEAWEEVFEKRISKDKLYAEVRAGRIPHMKIGAKILFRRDVLEEWFRQKERED